MEPHPPHTLSDAGRRPRISILIPCHNEEVMIAACLHSCLVQTRPFDEIIVVNDGSTDNTQRELDLFNSHITCITIPLATGNKSHAQQIGLQSVTGDIVVCTDADTLLDQTFTEHIERDFLDPNVSAVAGYVRSTKINIFTALREIDYVLGQDLYKRAQHHFGFILVIPGCAAAFRTHLFRDGTLTFDHDTITEDLDFTFKLHQSGKQIIFNRNAVVYTQDPSSLYAYINQMRRWYAGGWQNLRKHHSLFQRPHSTLLLSITYGEALFFAFIYFFLPFLQFRIFMYFLTLNMIIIIGVGLYASWQRKRIDLLLYSPARIIFQYINSYIFIEQMVRELILRRSLQTWFKPKRQKVISHTPL